MDKTSSIYIPDMSSYRKSLWNQIQDHYLQYLFFSPLAKAKRVRYPGLNGTLLVHYNIPNLGNLLNNVGHICAPYILK